MIHDVIDDFLFKVVAEGTLVTEGYTYKAIQTFYDGNEYDVVYRMERLQRPVISPERVVVAVFDGHYWRFGS